MNPVMIYYDYKENELEEKRRRKKMINDLKTVQKIFKLMWWVCA